MDASLTSVRGIGPAAAEKLVKHGIGSLRELASASVEQLCEVPGFSSLLSPRIIADAKAILADSQSTGSTDKSDLRGEQPKEKPATASGGEAGKDRKGKKSKKGKKGKKDKKDKKDKRKKSGKSKSSGKDNKGKKAGKSRKSSKRGRKK